jgi:DNA polymerase III delta prime subunit
MSQAQEDINRAWERLSERRKEVLTSFLQGQTDAEISKSLYISESTVRKHIQDVCKHFLGDKELEGDRRSRRGDLIALFAKHKPELLETQVSSQETVEVDGDISNSEDSAPENSENYQDWGESPDVSIFYGREEELKILEQWVVGDRCRVVALRGMKGIGKTTLATKLAREIESQFEYVIYRSLEKASPLNKILDDLLEFFSSQSLETFPDNDAKISELLNCLKQCRCLLVLDHWDSLLQGGDFAGQYRAEYSDYAQLLRRIAQEPHQSCLLLSSSEKPREIAVLAGDTLLIREYSVAGLGNAARQILQGKGLSGQKEWERLINLFQGHPFALNIIASTIKELFEGDVVQFVQLTWSTLNLQDLRELVEVQFERLSFQEKQIMYWLAIAQAPVSFAELRSRFPNSETSSNLLDALKSLKWRSLMESKGGGYGLQPVVIRYVTHHIIQQVCQEIKEFHTTQQFNLLRTYELNSDILSRVKKRFSSSDLVQHCEAMLANLASEVGYARENLEKLIKLAQ